MMDREDWIARILDVVRGIASRDFQQRSWLGVGPEVSSPDEMYNELFDDMTFDLFFERYGGSLTAPQRLAWKDLKAKLEAYEEEPERLDDPGRVVSDPEWQQVRDSAARFLAAFGA